jgi:hypothetical protein
VIAASLADLYAFFCVYDQPHCLYLMMKRPGYVSVHLPVTVSYQLHSALSTLSALANDVSTSGPCGSSTGGGVGATTGFSTTGALTGIGSSFISSFISITTCCLFYRFRLSLQLAVQVVVLFLLSLVLV